VSWPICPDCGGTRIKNEGPAYDASEKEIRVFRGHLCLGCGWRAWSVQMLFSEEAPTLQVRGRFGGYLKSLALALFRPRRKQPSDSQLSLFD